MLNELSELSRSLFGPLLIELFVVFIAIVVRDDKPKMAKILGFGTLLAGFIGFGSTILQNINPQIISSIPIIGDIVQPATEVPQEQAADYQFSPSGLGEFTFGQYDFDEESCVLKDHLDKATQLELWQTLWLGFTVPYQAGDVGNIIYWTVYLPDGNKLYDNIPVILDDTLCNWTSIEMDKNSPTGQYYLLVTYQENTVFEKYFQIEYYDLSEVILPNRPGFGTGIKLGRNGAKQLDCILGIETDTFNAADFASDEWVYYVAPYQDSEVGNKYKYQVYDQNMVLVQYAEQTLKDEYQHCAWGGFSLGNNPDTGKYLFRILYQGEEVYQKDFWIK